LSTLVPELKYLKAVDGDVGQRRKDPPPGTDTSELDFVLFDMFTCVHEENGRRSEFDAVFVHTSVTS